MATAFERAAARLHVNPNWSVEAAYRPLGQGPERTIRVIPSVPDERRSVSGQPILVGTVFLQVLRADVERVLPSDVFTFGDRCVRALVAELDVEGVTWSVQCRNDV